MGKRDRRAMKLILALLVVLAGFPGLVLIGADTAQAGVIDNKTWNNVGGAASSAGGSSVSVSVYSGTPYVAFQDFSASSKATVKRFVGGQWETVGSAGFSAGTASGISLYMDGETPYVAYIDGTKNDKMTVMKYNGSSWNTEGSAGFSEGVVYGPSLYVDNGYAYVAYQDAANSSKVTVMKFNGTSWSSLGSKGFYGAGAYYMSLRVHKGVPYLAFRDGTAVGRKATVMKYASGTNSWSAVGTPGFSAGQAEYASLYFDDNDHIYVAYSDGGNGSKATVMKYNGSSWATVGSAGFSAGAANFTSLFIENNFVYVAYQDVVNSSKATLMKYDGSSWTAVGGAGLSAGSVGNVSLYVYNGIPYVGYQDNMSQASVVVKNYSAVPATANSANNVLFATPNAAEVGETISLTAAGHRQAEEGNVIGDERYVPEAWASDDEKSGTFSIIGTAYTSSYTPDVVGFTKVTATFQKQTWDGEVWNNTDSPIKKQVIISVSAVKSYTMAAIGDQTLMELTEDYISGSQETKAIRITLTGTGDLAGLSVSLSGANADDFAVTQPILTTLNSISTNTTFTVKAKDDLAIGTYTATVTVSATKMTPAVSFTVGQTVIAPSPPAPPQQLTAAGGDRQAALSWSTVSGATYYNLYMGTETSQYGTEPIETVTGTTYNVLNLLNGTTYYFMVKAGNAVGLSGASNEASAAPRTVPGTPTNIVAIAGDRQAIVTFLPPADHGGSPITGYEVSVSPGDTVAAGTTSPITVSGLTNGTSYTFTVKAINVAGSGLPSAASNSIMPVEPVVVTIEEKQTTSTGIEVLINGKVENAGTASTVEVEGRRVTTIVVDKDKLEQRLAAEADHAVITIPIKIDSEVIIGELDGSMVKSMEEKQAIIEIRTARATYTLPAQLIDIDEISRQMGSSIQLKDIRIRIQIATPSSDMMKVAEAAAIQGSFTLVVPPVDFTVSGTHGETTVDVPKFHAYVLRTVAIPEGVDPNQITTGVVVEADGTVRHVPTKVIVVDGSYYAQISSLTNSTYSVVWHPVEFSDVADHWAKEAVNDMGSRMVVDGAGEGLFNPDLSVTRAEFAAIVVRGLGLKLEQGAAIFKDVHAADWYNSSVRTAYVNGLIEGFEDGSFRPSDRITREQAMVVIARAMAITELKKNSASDLVDGSLLQFADAEQISEWAKGAMSQALQAELVSGRSGGMLAPKADLTRAEVAAIVQRLLHKSGLI